jgi:RNA polymerase sigma-70 factor, ECF subfamily
MSAEPTRGPNDAGPKTLGDVLYPDGTKNHVPESAWVDLVRSIAGGDQRSLHALYERAHRIVFTLTFRITNSRETAEELTVDVFHDVWRRAAMYDPANGTVIGWIMNQARSRAIDRLRFEQRKKRVNSAANAAPESGAPEPQEAVDLAEQGRRLRSGLNALNPDERTAIESAFFGGLTYSEVAERLAQPLGTIKTRIRSGLAKLRQGLGSGVEPQ